MSTFQDVFGSAPHVTASAPGRVNLIGEHTDYNEGFVLPTVIPQQTTFELTPRGDTRVRAYAADLGLQGSYTLGQEARTDSWLDYVQGVTQELVRSGVELGGFDARITSTVPRGSGLSSSAALLVALIRGLRELYGFQMTDTDVALLARQAENGLVGANVGIMDQMACSLATAGEALFLDCRDLSFERVVLPQSAELVVLHSGVEHQNAGGGYNTRRAECEQACSVLGVASLRDLGMADLPRLEGLPDVLARRARHVITENDRVLRAVQAFRTGDLAQIGRLFLTSHQSMRDDYEVSVPEVDLIVELARARDDVYGARLTGGGFGGSVVMLAHPGCGLQAGRAIRDTYARQSSQVPVLLLPQPASSESGGADDPEGRSGGCRVEPGDLGGHTDAERAADAGGVGPLR